MVLMSFACPKCGSVDGVVRDAYASWDVDAQAWVLESVYDSFSCQECGENDITPREFETTEEEEQARIDGEP